MKKLEIFLERMKKIGINLELVGNYPWIYLDRINGKKVKEKFDSRHGFVIGYSPIKPGQHFEFKDTKVLFELLKEYKFRRGFFETKLREEVSKLSDDSVPAEFENGARWAFNL
jgi:hypothetical protein